MSSLPRVRLHLGSSLSSPSSRSPSLLERRGSSIRLSVDSSSTEPKDGIPTFALRLAESHSTAALSAAATSAMDKALVADALRSCPTDKLSSILSQLCVEDPTFNARLHTAMQGGDSASTSSSRRTSSFIARTDAHAHFAGRNGASSTPYSQRSSQLNSHSHPQAQTPTSPRHVLQVDGQSHFLDHELKYRNGALRNGGHRSRSQKPSRRRMMPGRAVTSYVGKSSSPRGHHVRSSSPRAHPALSSSPPRGSGNDDYYGSNPLSIHTAPAPVSRVLPSRVLRASNGSEQPGTPAHITNLNNYGAPVSPTYSPRGSKEDIATPRRNGVKATTPRTRPRSTSPLRRSRVHDVRNFFEEQAAINEQQKQREIALRQLSPRRSRTLQRSNTCMPTYHYDQKTRMRLIQSPSQRDVLHKTMPRPAPPLRGQSAGALFPTDAPSASSPRSSRGLSTSSSSSSSKPPPAADGPPRRQSSETGTLKRTSIKDLFRAVSTPSLAPRAVVDGAASGSATASEPQLSPIADDRITRERERARSPIGRIARGRRTRGIDNDDEPYDLMRLVSPTTASIGPRSRSRATSPSLDTRSSSSIPLSQRKGPRPFSPSPSVTVIPYVRSPSVGRSGSAAANNPTPLHGTSHFPRHRSSSPSTSISSLGLPSFERPESPTSTQPRPLSLPSLHSEKSAGARHVSMGSDSYSIRDYLAGSRKRASEKSPSRLSRRSSSSHFRTRSISPTRRRGGGASTPSDNEPSYSIDSHYSARSPSRNDRFSRVHRVSSTPSEKPAGNSRDFASSKEAPSSSSGKRKFKMKRPRFFQKDNDSDKQEKDRQDREQKRRGSFSLSRPRSVASPQSVTSPAERALEEESFARSDKESFFRSPFSDRKKYTPMSNPANPSHRKHSSAHDVSSFVRRGEARSMHASRNRSRRFSLFSFKRVGGNKDAAAAASAAYESSNVEYSKSTSIFARKENKSNAHGGLRSRSPSRSMSRPPVGDFTSSSRFKKYGRQMGVHDVLAGQLTSLLRRTPSTIQRERLQRFVESLEQEPEKGAGSVRDRSVSSPHHPTIPHTHGHAATAAVGSVSRGSNSYTNGANDTGMNGGRAASPSVPESATAKIVRRHSRIPFDRINRHEQAFDWFVNEPVARRHFGAFLRKQHADENLLFSTECADYAAIANEDERHAKFIKIWKLYIEQGALRQVNLSAAHANGLRDIYEQAEAGEIPPRDAFARTRSSILRLIRLPFLEYLKSDDYNNYVKVTNRHHSYTSQAGLKQVTWDEVQKMIHGASLPKLLERDPSLYGEYLLEQGVPMKNVIQIVCQAKKSISGAKSPPHSGRSSPEISNLGAMSSLASSLSSVSNAASTPSPASEVAAASAKEQHQRYLSSKQAQGQHPQLSRSGTFVMLPGELAEEPDIDDDWLFKKKSA